MSPSDTADVRELCDLDRVANVFVAARLDERALGTTGSAFGLGDRGHLRSALWCGANVVPVALDPTDVTEYVARIRRGRKRFSSVFGPAAQVLPLWEAMAKHWPTPMSLRPNQPLMVARGQAGRAVATPEPRVRRAARHELDAVLPAAAAMFTEEIGYAPYVGSDRTYRAAVSHLIEQGRTFVLMDGTRVRFKADIGALASGVAQIQGVWVDPAWRGRGLAAPCMAAVVDAILADTADTVSLYVNDYNVPALRAYEASGFERVGTFATVIL